MIDILFEFGDDVILVRVDKHSVTFGNTAFGTGMADISCMKLDYVGVCREFPDLEMRKDWREEAIKRFKEKIKEMKNEKEIGEYIIEDLRKYGYVPKYIQKNGFRREVIK